jgi:hypothetical protein
LLRCANGVARHYCRRKPRHQWLVLIPNAHEGYLSWEEFERVQKAIKENTLGSGRHQERTRDVGWTAAVPAVWSYFNRTVNGQRPRHFALYL